VFKQALEKKEKNNEEKEDGEELENDDEQKRPRSLELISSIVFSLTTEQYQSVYQP
jgi:hypothetical protein